MSQFVSRVLVTVVGVPVVLGVVYLGGWWLFGLAAVAALVALHELYRMARALRPLVLAGYIGALATLLGAQLGGAEWMIGGFMLTLVLAFLLYGIAGDPPDRDGDDEHDDPRHSVDRAWARVSAAPTRLP
jgi:CDP-diglyceride synthetase